MRCETEAEIIKVEQSVTIARPVEEVFSFVADFRNWPDMQPAPQASGTTSEGPMKKGERFLQIIELPGQRVDLVCEVIGYAPNESFSLQYTWEKLLLDVDFTFAPADEPGVTKLTGRGEGRMGGLARLLEPLVNQEINREVAFNLDNVKSQLESGNSGGHR